MSRVYRRRRVGYTVVWNDLFLPADQGGPGLSNAAIGLFARMLSKPDDWDFAADRLAGECKEGRAAILSQLRELEAAGYLWRPRVRCSGGRVRTLVFLSDEPVYKGRQDELTQAEVDAELASTGVQQPHCGGVDSSVTPDTKQEEQETTTSSHGRAPRAVPEHLREVAREAEAGTLTAAGRKRTSRQDQGRDVSDRAHITSGWPAKRKAPTRRQRAHGVAQRFTEDAREAFPDEAMQVNLRAVDAALWKVMQESPSVTWEQLDRARELFMGDTASLHRAGVPVWKNFLHHLPRLVEQARREGSDTAAPLTSEEKARWFGGDDKGRAALTSEEKSKWFRS